MPKTKMLATPYDEGWWERSAISPGACPEFSPIWQTGLMSARKLRGFVLQKEDRRNPLDSHENARWRGIDIELPLSGRWA